MDRTLFALPAAIEDPTAAPVIIIFSFASVINSVKIAK